MRYAVPNARKETIMKKTLIALGISAAFLVGSAALAEQTRKPTEPQRSPQQMQSSQQEEVTGTVTFYAPGKRLEIQTEQGQTKSFDLGSKDVTARVESSVAVGTKVRVAQTIGANGKKLIEVSPSVSR
jgi:hypothetical protein